MTFPRQKFHQTFRWSGLARASSNTFDEVSKANIFLPFFNIPKIISNLSDVILSGTTSERNFLFYVF